MCQVAGGKLIHMAGELVWLGEAGRFVRARGEGADDGEARGAKDLNGAELGVEGECLGRGGSSGFGRGGGVMLEGSGSREDGGCITLAQAELELVGRRLLARDRDPRGVEAMEEMKC